MPSRLPAGNGDPARITDDMTNIPSVHPSPGSTDHIVVGLLPNLEAARRAIESLRSYGLSDDHIGLAMRQTGQDALSHANATPSPTVDDTAKGAVGGSLVGGLAGLLTATGLIAVPGLAPCWRVAPWSRFLGRPAPRSSRAAESARWLAVSLARSSASTSQRPQPGSMRQRSRKGRY